MLELACVFFQFSLSLSLSLYIYIYILNVVLSEIVFLCVYSVFAYHGYTNINVGHWIVLPQLNIVRICEFDSY